MEPIVRAEGVDQNERNKVAPTCFILIPLFWIRICLTAVMGASQGLTIAFEEPVIPKRPIILKSDREIPKEQPKEKIEKEKQPMIILKTRESSTSKDEHPQSSKAHNVDGELSQPNKIAQNEQKDKKNLVTEQKLFQPIPVMQEVVKLLDENLEFNNSALEFLHDSSTNYLVVGVIGTQGVGKSMILNLIARNKSMEDICSQILNSHEMPSNSENTNPIAVEEQLEELNLDDNADRITRGETSGSNFKFKMQDMEQIERGLYCTKGIDMYVTNDRVILLDCQSLWSPSLLDSYSGNLNPITARSANVVTIDSLQLATYLMTICHVLIAVQDWFTDYNFLRYIQTSEMLKPFLSASHTMNTENAEGTGSGENYPHLLMLQNRCTLEDYTPENVKVMQTLYRTAFRKSKLQLDSGMYLYSDVDKNYLNVDAVCKEYNVENCGMPLNLFLLPEIYEDYDNRDIYRGHPSFEKLAQRLRWMVLGVNRHQITNVSNLSEKGWFQYCNKAWETIRKCTFFIEYERFLP